MAINKLKRLLSTFFSNPEVFFGKKDYIFIVSHMRSYSSLLAHILGSYHDICGYLEMHQSYSGWLDFMRLRYKVYLENGNQLNGGIVLDKLLHNYCRISDNILNGTNLKVIFMLRDPEDAIKSIIYRGKNSVKVKWAAESQEAVNYYSQRLENIAGYAPLINKNGLLINSEKLINDADHVLDFLTNWLGLSQKLDSNYSIFKNTGMPGYGDVSEELKAGKIVKKKVSYDDIHISPDILKQAKESYENCRAVLLKNCDSV